MTYIKTGYCCRCGECCKIGMLHMLDFRGICKYLLRNSDLYICEIQQAIEEKDHDFIAMIPLEDFEYWKRECRNYPNPDDPKMLPPRHKLPEKCTYKLEKVE